MKKTHCKREHEFTDENTYVDSKGNRHCRACRAERMRARREGGPGRGANNSSKTHCPKNHEYTEANTRWDKSEWGSGKRRVCRTCAQANAAVQVIKKYGLTKERFMEMLVDQDNACAICEVPFSATPHIDHDHKCCDRAGSCGECVRGLLCGDCNNMLGRAHDDPKILRAAATYLG